MEAHASLELYGQHLLLLPNRAVFWREARMLIVADLHLGKGQCFHDRGVPVPVGTTAADLDRLSALLDRYHPDRLLFLGDLVHGRTAARLRRLHRHPGDSSFRPRPGLCGGGGCGGKDSIAPKCGSGLHRSVFSPGRFPAGG